MSDTHPPPKPSPLQKIISGDLGPLSRIQESLGLSLEELADWMADPQNRRRINDLITAQNAATESLLAQHRAAVAATLIQLALGDSAPPETRRRACIDILKLRIFDPHKDDRLKPRPPKPPPPRPMMHPDDVRAVMEALYYKNDPQSHPDDQPAHSSHPSSAAAHTKPGQSEDMLSLAWSDRKHEPRGSMSSRRPGSTSPAAIDSTPHAGSDEAKSPPPRGDFAQEDPDRPRAPATPNTTNQLERRVSNEILHQPTRTTIRPTWHPLFQGHKPSSHPYEVLLKLCPQLTTRFEPARDQRSCDYSLHGWPNAPNSHSSRPP